MEMTVAVAETLSELKVADLKYLSVRIFPISTEAMLRNMVSTGSTTVTRKKKAKKIWVTEKFFLFTAQSLSFKPAAKLNLFRLSVFSCRL